MNYFRFRVEYQTVTTGSGYSWGLDIRSSYVKAPGVSTKNGECLGPRNGLKAIVPVKILTFWGPGTLFLLFAGPRNGVPAYFHH